MISRSRSAANGDAASATSRPRKIIDMVDVATVVTRTPLGRRRNAPMQKSTWPFCSAVIASVPRRIRIDLRHEQPGVIGAERQIDVAGMADRLVEPGQRPLGRLDQLPGVG